MQILAGRYKGKRLQAGNDLSIRPLTNRLKENIFNILQQYVAGAEILDLFSGSGSFGLEALSRGASRVDFVEISRPAAGYLKSNLVNLKIDPGCYRIYQIDALRFCGQPAERYDLILMDPPFKFQHLQELTELITGTDLLRSTGILVIHHEITNPLAPISAAYRIIDQRRYGRSLISFIRRGE
jgi:16S rRNA (guanine966-N2)-methyltransferase